MNGHIGKPFDEAAFFRTLAQWIPEAKQRRLVVAPAVPPAGEFPPLSGIDTRAGLALLLGDEARFRHWLSDFVSEAPVVMTKIRQALSQGDTKSASLAAHSLKGRTGMLGMKALHLIAGEVEDAIEGTGPTDELLHGLQQGIAEICTEIQRGLGLPLAAQPVVEPALEKLPAGLPPASILRLVAGLKAGDGDCDTFVADCLAELEGTPWLPRLLQVRTLIQNFDFPAASRLLSDEM